MAATVFGLGLIVIAASKNGCMIAKARLFAGREYAEIFVVFELGVIGETEEAHQHHVVLHGDRYRRGDDRRGVAAVDQIDLIDVEKLGVDRRHVRRIALIVVVDELDLAGPAGRPWR